MTTGDGSIPGDDLDGDLDGDLDEDVIERLRGLDPVDVESLPSSRRAEAMRTLEEILGPPESAEGSVGEVDESSPSPAAVERDGEETPPPCSTSQ